MNLMERLPADFFKLFTSKYTEYYIRFLAAIYEEMSLSYSVLGLTERECKNVMNEKIATESLFWEEENMEELCGDFSGVQPIVYRIVPENAQ